MIAQEIAPHIERLTRALGDKVGKEITQEELEEQLRKFMEYGVPPDQAVRSMLRQYGASTPATAGDDNSGPVKLVDLTAGMSFVNLIARVVFVTEREIQVRGEPRTIWTGILGDDTGTRPFTSWRAFEYDKGTVLKIKGAYTKEFNQEIQVNLGDRAEVQETDADALPEHASPVQERTVSELEPGIGPSIVKARVMEVTKRTVTARGEEKTITTGMLADETGQIPFTAWADLELETGSNIRIETGYVKAYRGVPQFNFDDSATVEVLSDDALPQADDLGTNEPVALADIIDKGGASGALVEATLLEVRPGSGLVVRCNEDNRVLVDGECRVHGAVDGVPDLRVKAVLDDGTGALNAIINRAGTERLLGRSLEEARKMAEELGDPGVISDELATKLTGRDYRVRGNCLSDDFGIMMIVENIENIETDTKARAAQLRQQIEQGSKEADQ
jgi:replication factor A1